MKKSGAINKFLGWAAGIAGTVIASVLIYHFTTPAPPVTFEGMVINGAVNAPLQGAMVSFEIADTPGGPYHDFTDEHGSYRLGFNGLKNRSRAVIRAEANGFQPSRPLALASLTSDNRADFVLHPIPAHTGPGPTPSPTPQPTVNVRPPIYVRKSSAQMIRIQPLTHP